MFKLLLKNLLAHKRRLASTSLAVVFGVAFLSGNLVLTDTNPSGPTTYSFYWLVTYSGDPSHNTAGTSICGQEQFTVTVEDDAVVSMSTGVAQPVAVLTEEQLA